jgi:M6 family metalloprotease-like protein
MQGDGKWEMTMKNIRKLASLLIAWSIGLLVMTAAHAGPANIVPVTIDQPDGTKVQVIMRGDEFQGWMETSDGYTVLKHPTTGYLEYAVKDPGGDLKSSGFVVSAATQSLLQSRGAMPPKGLRPLRNVALEDFKQQFLSSIQSNRMTVGGQPAGGPAMTAPTGTWAPVPVSGAKKVLIVLVNFADATLSAGSSTYWNNAVFNLSSPSVAKYYQDNSFGAVSISPVAVNQAGSPNGVVTVTLGTTHPNCGSSCTYSTESTWINSALAAASPYVNFVALDANLDGTISVDEALIYFVVAGYETSASSGLSPSIWAHAWGGAGVTVQGKNVNHWALNGERYDASNLMQMGVIAHEAGHAMGGLPDLYDVNGHNEGLGIFSLMAAGSWGHQPGQTPSTTPVGLDAWTRQYLGWATPQTPVSGATASLVSGLASSSAPFMLMKDTTSTSEYWLVENRTPTSWDAGMLPWMKSGWTGGLLIQHIDLNVGTRSGNTFNAYVSGGHQGNMAEEASSVDCSLAVVYTDVRSSWGCRTILYYSGNSTAFSPTSTPNSNYYSGVASGLGVTSISAPGSSMTAVFGDGNKYTLTVAKAGTGSGTVTSNPAGISCGFLCSARYASGTSVTLTATPASGSSFAGWSGACTGTSSCVTTMSGARSVTATFNTSAGTSYTLSVAKAGTGSGTVTSNPAGISCGATCSVSYASGTSVTLTATPASGSIFAGWSGACTGTGSCVTTMSAARSVTATFDTSAGTGYTLTVTKAGTGNGTVTSNPAGINCGVTCSASYASGISVTLTATAPLGSTFTGWSGACTGTGSCVTTMSAARSVTATFNSMLITKLVSLAGAVDNSSLIWTTSGNAGWTGQKAVTFDGVDAAQSGLITDNQVSTLQTTVVGPGTLTFMWKVSSESGSDFLSLYDDGVLQVQISGEVDWAQQVWSIPAGTHVLEWRYQKDGALSAGSDRGWLDQVTFTP